MWSINIMLWLKPSSQELHQAKTIVSYQPWAIEEYRVWHTNQDPYPQPLLIFSENEAMGFIGAS